MKQDSFCYNNGIPQTSYSVSMYAPEFAVLPPLRDPQRDWQSSFSMKLSSRKLIWLDSFQFQMSRLPLDGHNPHVPNMSNSYNQAAIFSRCLNRRLTLWNQGQFGPVTGGRGWDMIPGEFFSNPKNRWKEMKTSTMQAKQTFYWESIRQAPCMAHDSQETLPPWLSQKSVLVGFGAVRGLASRDFAAPSHSLVAIKRSLVHVAIRSQLVSKTV